MEVYRITNKNQAYDLSGTDACSGGGRWNKSGTYVIYTAGSSSLAIVEALVHVEKGTSPGDLVMVTMDLPEKNIENILNLIQIPSQWNKQPPYHMATMAICQADFFQANLALKVPSAVDPKGFNYLINPLHTGMRAVRITQVEPFSFDPRFFQFSHEKNRQQ